MGAARSTTTRAVLVVRRERLALLWSGGGGGVIDWVMKAEGVSFRHAVELLQNDYLPLAAESGPAPKQSTVRKLPTPLERDAGGREAARCR